ncbi:MAG: 2-phosphosulfolactate phosphatase [Thermotogaceae bacterium]|jgi:2-phosphosulfolactate phosphatase|nr:2-phosphosulfolactate phosphatase [Thermotogaceae bacterium]
MNLSLVSFYSDTLIIDQSQQYDAVFLIDVYRATSTMVVMANSGAKSIKPVDSLNEAFLLRDKDPSVLLCGERDSIKPEGFDYGNDTALFHKVILTNKNCVITTSNGTKALRAFANRSKTFFACSLLNLNTCIEQIQQSQYENILVLCAGNWGKFSLEDYLCSALLISGIQDGINEMNDEIKLALEVGIFYKRNPDHLKAVLKKTDHALKLKEQDKFGDVCFIVENINGFECVPRLGI